LCQNALDTKVQRQSPEPMSALPQSAQLHEILATPVCIAATHPKMARGKPQTTGTSDSADGSQAELRSQNGPTAIQPRCHSDTTYLRSLALDALVTGSGHHDEMVQAATGGRCQLPGMSVGELVTADEDALGNAPTASASTLSRTRRGDSSLLSDGNVTISGRRDIIQ